MSIIIKHKFKSLIRPLSPDEYEILEQSLLDEGCRDPLVVWGDILLDGHNRHAICTKHDIPFNTVPAPLYIRTEEDAEDWIDKNQLGRRNLTRDEFTLIVGRRYNRKKGTQGGDHKSKDQNDTLINAAEIIAADHNVSPATVKRAGKFAEKVEQIKQENPEADEPTVYRLAKEAGKKQLKTGGDDGGEAESDVLFQLKLWWRKATKKDRRAFIAWSENN